MARFLLDFEQFFDPVREIMTYISVHRFVLYLDSGGRKTPPSSTVPVTYINNGGRVTSASAKSMLGIKVSISN